MKWYHWNFLGAGLIGLITVTLAPAAQEEVDKVARKRASEFLAALGKGDTKGLKDRASCH